MPNYEAYNQISPENPKSENSRLAELFIESIMTENKNSENREKNSHDSKHYSTYGSFSTYSTPSYTSFGGSIF